MTDLSKVLPHDKPMILLDDILEVDLERKFIKTVFTVNDKNIFFDKKLNGIPSLCGIEFMAQTVGCYGFYAKHMDEPKIGFLLGTRLFNNTKEIFHNKETYTVVAKEAYYDDEISALDCYIYDKLENEISSATINVYQSENDMELLKFNG